MHRTPQPAGHSENATLARLLEITHDILQARELSAALESIAQGVGDLFGFKYVSIVASDTPGGQLYRRVVHGFDAMFEDRLNERISRDELVTLLSPQYEVFENCYYMPAERELEWAHNIDSGRLSIDGERRDPSDWHGRDSLVLTLQDRSTMLGYMSIDGPIDGKVPSHETLRRIQLFVNLVGLALSNARSHAAAIEQQKLLEDTSRAQNDFFTMVSHEVRSPLAAIRGATALLQTHFENLAPQRRHELLKVLDNSTARLGGIFEDFLLLSRMDAGQLSLRIETVDPEKVVKESLARMLSEYPDREFTSVVRGPIHPIAADEGRVVQILINLLSNAAKYSTPDSTIAVELAPHDGSVRFSVRNEGPGIEPRNRDKLFTRFGRLRADDSFSIGLGLYICAQLTELMGGAIGAESVPNQITTFWFSLPPAGSPTFGASA
ncbi:MAG: HAMP domain-containing histidine kinase [Candidatus Eremiobacteraeota bacterium]|nr:HAMP domain-containing histidine kinase [Candidatus Eremiobacteraeota bacterium]